jgi:hypothetical protein
MKIHDLVILNHSKYTEIIWDNAPNSVVKIDAMMGVKYYCSGHNESDENDKLYYFQVVDVNKLMLFRIKYGF